MVNNVINVERSRTEKMVKFGKTFHKDKTL